MADDKEKDRWDKLDIILKPMGGVVAALIVGVIGSNILQRQQQSEIDARLYTELMSRREEAESALRKDMFVSIIQSFLKPGQEKLSIYEKILNLELLCYNFHESLNLKPLFVDLRKEVSDAVKDPGLQREYITRLEKVASDVTRKQMLVIEGAGGYFDQTINTNTLQFLVLGDSITEEPFAQETLTLRGMKRDFKLTVEKVDAARKELQMGLEIKSFGDSGGAIQSVAKAEFWLGFFDFPMIDNTRLSNDQRCAVVLNGIADSIADITVVYFPGSYASLREKPYYEEVLEKLRGEEKDAKTQR